MELVIVETGPLSGWDYAPTRNCYLRRLALEGYTAIWELWINHWGIQSRIVITDGADFYEVIKVGEVEKDLQQAVWRLSGYYGGWLSYAGRERGFFPRRS